MANNRGIVQVAPKSSGGKQTTTCHSKQGQSSSFDQTTKTSHVDKQTGKYASETNEQRSSEETFKDGSTGRVFSKIEHENIHTSRVGDNSGYTERTEDEKYQRVNYGGGGSGKKGGNYGGGSKK